MRPTVAATIRGIGTRSAQKNFHHPDRNFVQKLCITSLTSYYAYSVGNGNQTLIEICVRFDVNLDILN